MQMKLFSLFALIGFVAVSAARAEQVIPRSSFIKRVESCEAILRELQEKPETAIPSEVLSKAKGIVITNQVRVGFVLGVKDGYGVAMVRRPDGQWSIPVVVNAGEASLGLQLGGAAIETVFVMMDDQTPRLLFQERMNVGVDAKAVAGPRVAERERVNRAILETPVLVYSKTKGLFAGASVKAGYLSRTDASNRAFYKTDYALPELLYSDWVSPQPEVQPLMAYVAEITR
jgi:SH3 domain-containing YSC84-like protein 1